MRSLRRGSMKYMRKQLLNIISFLCVFSQTLYAQDLTSKNVNSQLQSQQLFRSIISPYFQPMPSVMPGSENDTAAQIRLGKRLYFDTQLSVNNTQSCNSCHNLIGDGAGVDHLPVSIGALGKLGQRNAPTTWNAGLHGAQFWDGRAKTLKEQAASPLFNPIEMALPSEAVLIEKLTNSDYLTDFKQAFPEQTGVINLNNITHALAAFQRTLLSSDRFDLFLKGDEQAISAAEKNGLMVFINKGCVGCHNGPLLGSQLFMKMGLVNSYPNTVDKGRAQVTGKASDNFFFKVPSLRDVINTAPYFHDGAVYSIEQAIEDTGWHQLGIKLSENDVQSIKTFFGTLNNQAEIIVDEISEKNIETE